MRCARCDRLAVPQAVGLTPEGLVVFGWCLDCLKETGCTEIEVVTHNRASLNQKHGPQLSLVMSHPGSPRSDRHHYCFVTAGLLGLWALVLLATGLWRLRLTPPPIPSPLGQGTPALLLGGGVLTGLTALFLLGISYGWVLPGTRQTYRWIQSVAFMLALVIFLVGLITHHPDRDPFVVAAAGLSLGVSLAAHWRERSLASTAQISSRTHEKIRRP